jgi:hypothetical protein
MRLARQLRFFHELVNRHEQHVELQDHATNEIFKIRWFIVTVKGFFKLNSIMTNNI